MIRRPPRSTLDRSSAASDVYKRQLKYDPLYWGAVFPLGMYAVSTHRMSEAMGFNFLGFLPPTFLYIALVAWAAVSYTLLTLPTSDIV